MSKVARVAGGVVALLVIAIGVFAAVLAYNAGPATQVPITQGAVLMQAVRYRQYGPPGVLQLTQAARPLPAADELLIRVHAASLNPLDWHYLRGEPYVVRMQLGVGRPKSPRLGVDFAGTVEAVGWKVHQFKPGDAIFGTADGTLAQYTTSTEAGLALKPDNISFAQAAAIPVAGVTALQGLRLAHLARGQKILINGASGGVGTFAVQLAKDQGAQVTAVCSTGNIKLVSSLGADRVIDYGREDFTRGSARYDVIFDTVGNHGLRDYDRILSAKGVVVLIGGPSYEPWLGPLLGFMKAKLMAPVLHHPMISFFADVSRTEDFNTLRDLIQAGHLVPVVDRQYPLAQTAEAMTYLEQGHARGKVVVNVD